MHATEAVEIQCPYCGEMIEVIVDCSVEDQRYIEDCEVCCRPMQLSIAVDLEGQPAVEASQEDDT